MCLLAGGISFKHLIVHPRSCILPEPFIPITTPGTSSFINYKRAAKHSNTFKILQQLLTKLLVTFANHLVYISYILRLCIAVDKYAARTQPAADHSLWHIVCYPMRRSARLQINPRSFNRIIATHLSYLLILFLAIPQFNQ